MFVDRLELLLFCIFTKQRLRHRLPSFPANCRVSYSGSFIDVNQKHYQTNEQQKPVAETVGPLVEKEAKLNTEEALWRETSGRTHSPCQ